MAKKEKSLIWAGMAHGVRFTREGDGRMFWAFGGKRGELTAADLRERIGDPVGDEELIYLCENAATLPEGNAADLLRLCQEIAGRSATVGESGGSELGGENGAEEKMGLTRQARTESAAESDGEMRGVELALIDVSPYQTSVRRGDEEYDPDVLQLAASIAEIGLAEPMVVRKVGERFEMIAGHRRLAALRMCGKKEAMCIVRDVSDKRAEELHVIENLQRKDLSAMEEARSVARMLENGRTHEEVAKATGKSVRWVYRRASITKLVPAWRDAAERYALSAAFLERIGRLPAAVQTEVLQSMAAEEELFKRGGDVAVLDEEIEVSLRKLSAAPWARIAGDPAKCAGCPDRSDAVQDLFEEMEGEPRCMNRVCWDKKVAAFVAAGIKQLKKECGQVIEATTKTKYLYQEKKDAAHTVPVMVTAGTDAGKLLWAESPEAVKARAGGEELAKGPTEKDLERGAYIAAVAACIESGGPVWDSERSRAAPAAAVVAFAIGCGVSPFQCVPANYSGPVQRSVRICELLEEATAGNENKWLAETEMLWKAARPGILKALNMEGTSYYGTLYAERESLAVKVKEALDIPDDMIAAFVAELAPKKAAGKKAGKR